MANSEGHDWREALAAFLAAQIPHADSVEVVQATTMADGASNDTLAIDVRVTCDGVSWDLPLVLRPQRSDGVLAPYDVGRQFRVMRALGRTAVPVPAVAWHEPAGTVLGTPFFVMQRVTGTPLPMICDGVTPALRAAAEALAGVHAVRWQDAGLAFLAPEFAVNGGHNSGEMAPRHDGWLPSPAAAGEGPGVRALLPSPVECELSAWEQRAWHLRLARMPLLVRLAAWLRANEPADSRIALLHGDPNPTNFLIDGGHVVAVLDWEVAGLGDPRSDLGFYSALLTLFHNVPEIGGRTALSLAYEDVTGTPLLDLAYYEALGLYKMMIIVAGRTRLSGHGISWSVDPIVRRLSELLGPRWAG